MARMLAHTGLSWSALVIKTSAVGYSRVRVEALSGLPLKVYGYYILIVTDISNDSELMCFIFKVKS